ncbi:MAG: alpha-glycosidase [Clostridiaceae bacterium]|nr:alpha-glycosidase [Clostridiaceae bacterium]
MQLEAIYHKPYSEYAYPDENNTLVIRLKTKKNDIEACILIYHEKYDPSLKGSVQMEMVCSDQLFDYYEARLSVGIKRFKYMFYLEDHLERKWYNQNGFFNYRPENGQFCYSSISKEDVISEVDWFVNSSIYQIFPDRFCRHQNTSISENSFHGGNIKGVISKIDYLVDLGVNAIYLNPIFKSGSYHRYDIEDFFSIDPVFGDKEELKKLIELCHDKGIKVIFDGVFNHCSDKFFAFYDVKQNGLNSEYKDWFHIRSYPIYSGNRPNYECFSYFGDMPKLNTGNPQVAKYIIEVVKYWTLEFGVDGWRFDVADEIDRKFWRELRLRVKEYNKDIVLIGEIFDEASSWLNGDQFDSVTNYPLKALIDDLFAYRSVDAEGFKLRVNNYLMKFRSSVTVSMLNIIGTHDTSRFLTLCANAEERFELAVVFQFTFPGVPLVYYGDEIGMTGEGDPHCRKPMIWDESKWNMNILRLYRFLIALRKRNKVIRNGKYRDVRVDGDKGILAYMRENDSALIIVVMNTSPKKVSGIIDTGDFSYTTNVLECLNTKTLYQLDANRLKLELRPYEWRILKPVLN